MKLIIALTILLLVFISCENTVNHYKIMQQVNMSGDKFHYRVCTTVTGYQGHGSGNASIWKIEDKVDYRVHVDDLNNIKADHKKWANAMGKQFLDEMKNNQGGKTVDTYYK